MTHNTDPAEKQTILSYKKDIYQLQYTIVFVCLFVWLFVCLSFITSNQRATNTIHTLFVFVIHKITIVRPALLYSIILWNTHFITYIYMTITIQTIKWEVEKIDQPGSCTKMKDIHIELLSRCYDNSTMIIWNNNENTKMCFHSSSENGDD